MGGVSRHCGGGQFAVCKCTGMWYTLKFDNINGNDISVKLGNKHHYLEYQMISSFLFQSSVGGEFLVNTGFLLLLLPSACSKILHLPFIIVSGPICWKK